MQARVYNCVASQRHRSTAVVLSCLIYDFNRLTAQDLICYAICFMKPQILSLGDMSGQLERRNSHFVVFSIKYRVLVISKPLDVYIFTISATSLYYYYNYYNFINKTGRQLMLTYPGHGQDTYKNNTIWKTIYYPLCSNNHWNKGIVEI